MFHKFSIKLRTSNEQRGSALVLALFIIVVTTLLGAALVRMISANSETIAYEVIGTRAYQAAQAGAQRKLSELFPL
ncbi:MAG TPA: type II secretory pathway component, partial [Colwellia sp.]|nr:type II secretory pathway component [Colwellia sp.]